MIKTTKKGWLAVSFGVIWILLALATYQLLTVPRQQLFDFFPRWVGARAVLSGENPYSSQVTQHIQEGMFGQRLSADQDQHRFAYNALITWVLLPFWLLPFPVSVSLWSSLQFLLLLVTPLLVMSWLKWRPPPISFLVLLIFSVLIFRYSMVAVVLGQFIPFALAGLVFAGWGIAKRDEIVTTIAFISLLVRPEIVVLPLVFLLLSAWQEKMYRVITIWVGSAGVLWLLTRLRIGPWELDFLHGIKDYSEYASIQWPPLAFGETWLAVLMAVVIVIWGLRMWQQIRFFPVSLRLAWGLSVSVLMTLLIFPQTSTYTLTLSLLPAWIILWAAKDKWLVWLLTIIVLASPWFFHVAHISLLDQLLIPLALAVLLTFQYLKRRYEYDVNGVPNLG